MNINLQRQLLFNKIKRVTRETLVFIETLKNQINIVNTIDVDDLEKILTGFLKIGGTKLLYDELHEIATRLDKPGENTDYTFNTPVKIDREYKTLSDYLEKIYESLDEYEDFTNINI